MSDNNEKFSKVADVWIIVTTVFLALQLSVTTFTISYFLEKKELLNLYLFSTALEVVTMGLALSAFLAIRDPRMKRYSLPALIDRGVMVVYVSSIMSFITLGLGIFGITTHFIIAGLVSTLLITLSSAMYMLYRKTIHGKPVD